MTGEPDSVETVDSEPIPSVTTIQDNPDSVKLSELCARFITSREEMGTTSQTISGYILYLFHSITPMGLIPSILLIFVFLFSCGDSVEIRLIVEWNGTDETGRVRYMILNKNR